MEEKILIKKNENGVFTSNFEGELFSEEGNGTTILESVENLFYEIKLNEADGQEERTKVFIAANMEKARDMAVELFNIMGPDAFGISLIINKSGLSKDGAKLKLNFLTQFGFVQSDRPSGAGQKWNIVISSQDLQQYYFNQAEKWESTSKYYRGLGDQLKEMDKNEGKTVGEVEEEVKE